MPKTPDNYLTLIDSLRSKGFSVIQLSYYEAALVLLQLELLDKNFEDPQRELKEFKKFLKMKRTYNLPVSLMESIVYNLIQAEELGVFKHPQGLTAEQFITSLFPGYIFHKEFNYLVKRPEKAYQADNTDMLYNKADLIGKGTKDETND